MWLIYFFHTCACGIRVVKFNQSSMVTFDYHCTYEVQRYVCVQLTVRFALLQPELRKFTKYLLMLVSLGTNIGLLHHKTLLKKCWKLREGNILSININLRQICSISYLYPFQCNQIQGAPDDTTSFFLGIRQNMLSFFNIFDFKKISVKMYNMASF